MAAATPYVEQHIANAEDLPSTSCTEGAELIHTREQSAKPRGIWKVAVAAAVAGLVAVAGTAWARSKGESMGDEDTGLGHHLIVGAPPGGHHLIVGAMGTTWATYDTIGCSNWESIEISRTPGLTKLECQALCDGDSECTMYNYQATPCEPGWYVSGGCLLFKGTCLTERNDCWSLTYKIAVTTTA